MDSIKYDVYIINLKHRADRWEEISKHFTTKSSMLNPIKFEAFQGNPGWVYCAKSQMAIIEEAAKRDDPFVIISEDDTELVLDNFDQVFSRIMRWLIDHNTEWDIFNGNPSCCDIKQKQAVSIVNPSPLIIKYGFGKTANFVVYNKSSYSKIIKLKTIYNNVNKNYAKNAYDHKYCNLGLRMISSLPYITTQRTGFSDIEKYKVNYDWCIMQNGQNFLINRINHKYICGHLQGGLGNQMFIIAAVFAIAKTNSRSMVLPMKNFSPCQYRERNNYWDSVFSFYNNPIPLKGGKKISVENEYKYEEIVPTQPKVVLEGYFQNAQYFHKYRKDILNMFQPSAETLATIREKYEWLFDPETINVCIHVRRGDYVIKKHFHHNVPPVYYKKCITALREMYAGQKLQFVVFSDDIPWCQKNDKIEGDIYVSGEEDYIELYMMSLCDAYILANSSFSWWGAYLNNKEGGPEKVFMPHKWLENGKYPQGLVLDDWEVIKY